MHETTNKSVFFSTYFFFHTEWLRDPAYLDMQAVMGYDGTGIFMHLLCYLIDRPQYTARIDTIPTIARYLRISPTKLTRLVTEFNLFTVRDDLFMSPWLCVVMRKLDEQRAKSSAGGKKGMKNRWHSTDNQQNEALPPYEAPYNSIVEESREEESKGEDSKEEEKKEDDSTVYFSKKNNCVLTTDEKFDEEFQRLLDENSEELNTLDIYDQDEVERFRVYYKNIDPSTNKTYYMANGFNLLTKMKLWRRYS